MKNITKSLAIVLLLDSFNAEGIRSLTASEYAKGQDYLR